MAYDKDWAAIIAWLQQRHLILHVPLSGPIWFEDKASGRRVAGF